MKLLGRCVCVCVCAYLLGCKTRLDCARLLVVFCGVLSKFGRKLLPGQAAAQSETGVFRAPGAAKFV